MPINPIIRAKIETLDVPDKIKGILNEILDTEDRMTILGDTKNAANVMGKILAKYDDDLDVQEFCKQDD